MTGNRNEAVCGTVPGTGISRAIPACAVSPMQENRTRYSPRSGKARNGLQSANRKVRDGFSVPLAPRNGTGIPERSPALMQALSKREQETREEVRMIPGNTLRMLYLALIALLLIAAGTGMVGAAPVSDQSGSVHSTEGSAASLAAPGGSLYGLKLGLESLNESFAPTADQRILRQVDHAGLRIDEAKAELEMDKTTTAAAALIQYRDTMDATAAVASGITRHSAALQPAEVQIREQEQVLRELAAAHAGQEAITGALSGCVKVKGLIGIATDTPVTMAAKTGAPTPTQTVTASLTTTPEPTPTGTPTQTPTPTPSPTVTPTPTPTPSPTATPAFTVPVVSGTAAGSTIALAWNAIPDPDLQGYKVVVSKTKPSPKYPDDGYMYWITDRNQNYATLDTTSLYTGGDIGGTLQPGQKYNISITAVYSGSTVAGNTLTMTMPGTVTTTATPTPTVTTAATTVATTATTAPAYTVPSVTAQVSGTTVVMNWQKSMENDFVGYKVVISKNKDNPVYPADGYMFWITNRDTTSAIITSTDNYQGGDIGGHLQPGTSYAFSVTAIYGPSWIKVAGNSVRLTFPDTATPTPTATTSTTPSGASGSGAVMTHEGVPAVM
jgi:hypothetical protein